LRGVACTYDSRADAVSIWYPGEGHGGSMARDFLAHCDEAVDDFDVFVVGQPECVNSSWCREAREHAVVESAVDVIQEVQPGIHPLDVVGGSSSASSGCGCVALSPALELYAGELPVPVVDSGLVLACGTESDADKLSAYFSGRVRCESLGSLRATKERVEHLVWLGGAESVPDEPDPLHEVMSMAAVTFSSMVSSIEQVRAVAAAHWQWSDGWCYRAMPTVSGGVLPDLGSWPSVAQLLAAGADPSGFARLVRVAPGRYHLPGPLEGPPAFSYSVSSLIGTDVVGGHAELSVDKGPPDRRAVYRNMTVCTLSGHLVDGGVSTGGTPARRAGQTGTAHHHVRHRRRKHCCGVCNVARMALEAGQLEWDMRFTPFKELLATGCVVYKVEISSLGVCLVLVEPGGRVVGVLPLFGPGVSAIDGLRAAMHSARSGPECLRGTMMYRACPAADVWRLSHTSKCYKGCGVTLRLWNPVSVAKFVLALVL